MIHPDVLSDHPFGGYSGQERSAILKCVAVEIGVVVLTIVCFVLLDLYVAGCEKV